MARYTHSSDNKGRIFIPAKLRNNLGGSVYVTRSLDAGYLAVYTVDQFAMIRAQIFDLPGTDPIARRFRREIIGEAIHCNLDSQGRIPAMRCMSRIWATPWRSAAAPSTTRCASRKCRLRNWI